MGIFKLFTILVIVSACVYCYGINQLNEKTTPDYNDTDNTLPSYETNMSTEIEKVTVEVYYESNCGYSKRFLVNNLGPQIPSMHEYLNIRLYPYGNAYTHEVNGQFEIECQHGENECYGNKLHACAIDILKNVTKSTLFVSCLCHRNSNDARVNECAKRLKFDGNPIKECAKGDKGNQLLKYYGDETNKLDFPGVLYVRINGEPSEGDFKEDVCSAFTQPPPPCRNVRISEHK